MGSHFSVLRPQPASILPTATSHHSRSSSHSHFHTSSTPTSPRQHDSFFSPSLSSLLGPTLPLDSPYWTTSLLQLCESLSALSGVTSAEVEAVLSRSCRAMHHSTIAQQHRNLHHLMHLVAHHIQRTVQRSDSAASAKEADESQLSLDAVLNLLFLCRTFLGYIIEHSTPEQLLVCFAYTAPPLPHSSSSQPAEPPPVASVFVSSLFSVLCHFPVSATTHDFQLESLHTLLTLFSSQCYHSAAPLQPAAHPFVSAALSLPNLTPSPDALPVPPPAVLSALLRRYTDEVCAHFERPSTDGERLPNRRSLLVSLRSGLSSILLLPYHIFRYFFPPPPLPYPLADRALLCLLLLAHQQHTAAAPNAYRLALSQLCDADEEGTATAEGGASASFDALYSALLYTLPSRSGVLLLFTLLHLAPSFLAYVYAKTEVELLILPLLHSLYTHIRSLDADASTPPTARSKAALPAGEPEPKGIYMQLIILLLLTSDASFVQQAHRQLLARLPWHTDYPLYNISLASLVSLLLLRLLSAQLSGRPAQRDGYVVSNVLAILANVSREGRGVHAAVARRMTAVLGVLVKRWKRVKKRERMAAVARDGEDGASDAAEVLSVLGAYLSVLCVYAHPSRLHDNIPLLYALMADKRRLALLADETRHAVDQRVTYLLGLIAHFELVADVFHRSSKKPHAALPLLAPTQPLTAASALPAPATASASSDLHPLLAALAADAAHWRATIASSSLGAYVVEGGCFQYAEEEGSFEFVIPYVWEVGRDEGGWKHGWGGGSGGGGSRGNDSGGEESEVEGEFGLVEDGDEADGLLAGEGAARANGTVPAVSVLVV